jgi:hypothetical protein
MFGKRAIIKLTEDHSGFLLYTFNSWYYLGWYLTYDSPVTCMLLLG